MIVIGHSVNISTNDLYAALSKTKNNTFIGHKRMRLSFITLAEVNVDVA